MMSDFLLIEYPFPSPPADSSDLLNTDGIAWLENLGVSQVKQDLIQLADFGGFSARVFHSFPLEEKIVLHRFNLFLFLWDDLVDECEDFEYVRLLHKELKAVALDSCAKTTTVVGAALQDVLRKIQPAEKFPQVMCRTVEAANWQIENRRLGRIPSVEEYWRERFWFSGFPLILSMSNIKISSNIVERINKITCAVNDVFSYAKEIKYRDYNNSVFLTGHYQELSVEQAIQEVISLHNSEFDEFLNCINKIECKNMFLQNWVAGNLKWHQDSLRYK